MCGFCVMRDGFNLGHQKIMSWKIASYMDQPCRPICMCIVEASLHISSDGGCDIGEFEG